MSVQQALSRLCSGSPARREAREVCGRGERPSRTAALRAPDSSTQPLTSKSCACYATTLPSCLWYAPVWYFAYSPASCSTPAEHVLSIAPPRIIGHLLRPVSA